MQIIEAFRKQAQMYPHKTAIFCGNASRTYEELENRVNKLSHFLLRNGMQKNDKVGIVLHNNIYFVEMMLAAANLGFALVPIGPQLPVEAIHKSFDSTDVKHVIADSDYFNRVASNKYPGICLSIDKQSGAAANYDESIQKMPATSVYQTGVTGQEPFILTLTSGSTGNPKPIVLTQNNKFDRAKTAIRLYNITADDITLAGTPLYHSLAERLVIIPLISGGTSVLMPGFSPALWLKEVKDRYVTFTIAVSSQLNRIAEALAKPPVPNLESLRCIVSSSALLETHIKKELLDKLQCDLHECYGTSEISVCTNFSLTEAGDKIKTVGKPIKEADIRIIDSKGNPLGPEEPGEIICKTALLFSGYYNREDLTKSAMLGGYFKTGDTGYMDKDGYLYYLGRIKDIIISGGINVYPADIEEVLQQLDGIEECAAFPYPDENLGEVIAVAVVPSEKGFNKREAAFYCAKKLADFQQPRKYFEVDQLPRNSMNKLMKHKLREQFVPTV